MGQASRRSLLDLARLPDSFRRHGALLRAAVGGALLDGAGRPACDDRSLAERASEVHHVFRAPYFVCLRRESFVQRRLWLRRGI